MEMRKRFLSAMYAVRKTKVPWLQKLLRSGDSGIHVVSTDTSSNAITTRSKPTAFPSALRSKRSAVQTLTEDEVQGDAVIQQTCSECGRKEMRYYTQQLRGADEGSTVFYTCECGHK